MIRLTLAWLVLFAILGGAFWAALWFDRHVMEPAVSRAASRALGITIDEYRQQRAEFWRHLRRRVLRR